jgi:hypothetical protein
LAVFAFKSDRDFHYAGIYISAAGKTPLRHIDICFNKLYGKYDYSVEEQAEEFCGIKEPERVFMYKEPGGKQRNREAHHRSACKFLDIKRPGNDYPEREADDKGGQYCR